MHENIQKRLMNLKIQTNTIILTLEATVQT